MRISIRSWWVLTAVLGVAGAVAAPVKTAKELKSELLEGTAASAIKPPGPTERVELTQLQASGSVDLATGKVQRNLLIQGKLVVEDPARVVGVTSQMSITQIQDENGRDLLKDIPERRAQPALGDNRRYMSTSWTRQRGRDLPIHVNAWINSIRAMPRKLARVKGHVYILIASRGAAVEVQPVRPGGLVELAHGLSIQITKMHKEKSRVDVEFNFDTELPNPFFSVSTQVPFVSSVTLLDEKGRKSTSSGWSVQKRRRDNDPDGPGGQAVIRFTVAEPFEPAALKFEIVTAVEERRVDFHAENLPSPLKAED